MCSLWGCRFLSSASFTPCGKVDEPTGKLWVLFRLAMMDDSPDRWQQELCPAAVAACGALCAFTSPHRPAVLAAVREHCSPPCCPMGPALSDAGVLRLAERQLPGAHATLVLTLAEAHLEDRAAIAADPTAKDSGTVLGSSGLKLVVMHESVWSALFLLLPAAAPYTASLADSRPHATAKKCLLAALLKLAQVFVQVMRHNDTCEPAHQEALVAALEPATRLVLQFESFLGEHQRDQHQQYDVATAMANCMYFFTDFAHFLPAHKMTVGGRPVEFPAAPLALLQGRMLQRVAAAPLATGSPWPLVVVAGTALVCAFTSQPWAAGLCHDVRQSVLAYAKGLGQLRADAAALTQQQAEALADGLFAMCVTALMLAPPQQDQHGTSAGFHTPEQLAHGALQHELQLFLAAQSSWQLLASPVPPAFLDQRSTGVLNDYEGVAAPTWRFLLAAQLELHWRMNAAAVQTHLLQSGDTAASPAIPLQLDVVALAAAAASWPLEWAIADPGEAAALHVVLQHSWAAAALLSQLLQNSLEAPTEQRLKPGALARCAVALLAFAQLDSMAGSSPQGHHELQETPMQKAQKATAWLRHHSRAAAQLQPKDPPNDLTVAAAVVRFLRWLAAAAPIATASAVLAEALPALEALARADPATTQQLAEVGGRWEWAPVAAALRRRLPRRMASRFLPEVDRVTTAVAGPLLAPEGPVASAATLSPLPVGCP